MKNTYFNVTILSIYIFFLIIYKKLKNSKIPIYLFNLSNKTKYLLKKISPKTNAEPPSPLEFNTSKLQSQLKLPLSYILYKKHIYKLLIFF